MLSALKGDRKFYKSLFALMIPIMIQTGITNFVGMLDNVMIGSLGTEQLTGVAIANQLLFVFNLCIFGATSGAGIYGAQFFGNSDHRGVRYTFRFKVLFSLLVAGVWALVFVFFGDSLISLYLRGEGSAESIALTRAYAKEYLNIMLFSVVPFALFQAYSTSIRECGEAKVPMVASAIAVGVNLVLNAVLIYGLLGAPAMGSAGAAIATVISRIVEFLIVAVWTHRHSKEHPFIKGAYTHFRIPIRLVGKIASKSAPIMVNELLWGSGVAVVSQCYSVRGLEVVAANNIAVTFYNLFSVTFMAAGVAIGVILGQVLGAGDFDRAKADSKKLLSVSVLIAVVMGAVFCVLAEFIPLMYNTTDNIRFTATRLMQIIAIAFPFNAYVHSSYFIMRAGGRIGITFLFDCVYMWVVNVPIVWGVANYSSIGIFGICIVNEFMYVIKAFIGAWLIKKGVWIRNIVKE